MKTDLKLKQENCAICLEKNNDILPCGHWVHYSCLQKHFKPECPVCRTWLDIPVYGTKPDTEIYMPSFLDSLPLVLDPLPSFLDPLPLSLALTLYQDSNIGLYPKNFISEIEDREEDCDEVYDEDYDEENPRGDNWDYEDV